MNAAQEKLRAQIVEKLNAPCSSEDKRINELLATFDRFFDNGHSKGCAVQMAYNGAECEEVGCNKLATE